MVNRATSECIAQCSIFAAKKKEARSVRRRSAPRGVFCEGSPLVDGEILLSGRAPGRRRRCRHERSRQGIRNRRRRCRCHNIKARRRAHERRSLSGIRNRNRDCARGTAAVGFEIRRRSLIRAAGGHRDGVTGIRNVNGKRPFREWQCHAFLAFDKRQVQTHGIGAENLSHVLPFLSSLGGCPHEIYRKSPRVSMRLFGVPVSFACLHDAAGVVDAGKKAVSIA